MTKSSSKQGPGGADMGLSAARAAEIAAAREQTGATRRNMAPGLEEILYAAVPVLDHGFVRPIDYMGDDAAIVQAARVSYGSGTKKVSEDRGLIRYLMRHRHTTPFEMCEIKFHVKLPVFVARQWIRHRTANVNEYSARYSILEDEFYVPAPDQLATQSRSNRQGRGAVLEGAEAARVLDILRGDAATAYTHYEEMLNETTGGESGGGESAAATKIDPDRDGLARELARINLPLNIYTQWYWKIDLHNLFHFLSLRADPHSQYEIRVYADAMADMVARWVPHAYEAFRDYMQGGVTLSRAGLETVRGMLAGEPVEQAASGLSPREWRELMALLKPGSE